MKLSQSLLLFLVNTCSVTGFVVHSQNGYSTPPYQLKSTRSQLHLTDPASAAVWAAIVGGGAVLTSKIQKESSSTESPPAPTPSTPEPAPVEKEEPVAFVAEPEPAPVPEPEPVPVIVDEPEPVVPPAEETSSQQVSRLVRDVATTIDQKREIDRIAEQRRVQAEASKPKTPVVQKTPPPSPPPAAEPPTEEPKKTGKRRLVGKALRKVIRPWKKWSDL